MDLKDEPIDEDVNMEEQHEIQIFKLEDVMDCDTEADNTYTFTTMDGFQNYSIDGPSTSSDNFLSNEQNDLQDQYIHNKISLSEYSSKLEELFEKNTFEDDEEDNVQEITLSIEDIQSYENSNDKGECSSSNYQTIEQNKSTIFDDTDNEMKPKKKKEKIPRPRVKLTAGLKGMLGEATLLFIKKGKKKEGLQMVLEVLRVCPNASDPYKILGTMYEALGDVDLSMKMFMIGAHLSSDNAEEWVSLGNKFELIKDNKQAHKCYSTALKIDPSLLDIHEKRSKIAEELDIKQRAAITLAGYLRFLKRADEHSDKTVVLEISKRTAKLYHEMKNYKNAFEALSSAFKFCPDVISPEDINLYLELLLILKQYKQCLDIFIKYCNIDIIYNIIPNENIKSKDDKKEKEKVEDEDKDNDKINTETIQILKCKINNNDNNSMNLPEIITKLLITIIHIRAENYFNDLIKALMKSEITQYGDLYLDVSETFAKEKYFKYSVNLLQLLVQNEKYNLPGVWKQLAESYEGIGDLDQCKIAFKKVLEFVPHYFEIRKHLSKLYLNEDNYQEAIHYLRQDTSGDKLISVNLLIEQLNLMQQCKGYEDEFVDLVIVLMSQSSVEPKNLYEAKILLNRSRYGKKIETLNINRGLPKDFILDKRELFTDEPPTFNQLDAFYRYSINYCIDNKQLKKLQKLIMGAFSSGILLLEKETQLDALTFDGVIFLMLVNKADLAYNLFRYIFLKYPNNASVNNIMNQITAQCLENKYLRNTLRLFQSKSHCLGLNMMYANNCTLTGNFKSSVNEYALISESFHHKNPLYLLLLATTYTHTAIQKFMDKKPLLVVHALTYMQQYKKERGDGMLQEVYYNIGRLYHQLGLLTNAIIFYKKALNEKPCFEKYDLKNEIAYNLYTTYIYSKAYDSAKYILYKYLVI